MASDPLGGTPYGDLSSSYLNNAYLISGPVQQQSEFAGQVGNQNVVQASANLSDAANYDLGVLSGNRGTVLATEAPEIGSILSSYDTARKAAGELTPRGGGRSATLNELPYKEAGDINKQIEQARPQAAQNLSDVAGKQAALGSTEQNLSQSDMSTTLDFLLGKSANQLDWTKFDTANGAALGQSIGSAAAQLLSLIPGLSGL